MKCIDFLEFHRSANACGARESGSLSFERTCLTVKKLLSDVESKIQRSLTNKTLKCIGTFFKIQTALFRERLSGVSFKTITGTRVSRDVIRHTISRDGRPSPTSLDNDNTNLRNQFVERPEEKKNDRRPNAALARPGFRFCASLLYARERRPSGRSEAAGLGSIAADVSPNTSLNSYFCTECGGPSRKGVAAPPDTARKPADKRSGEQSKPKASDYESAPRAGVTYLARRKNKAHQTIGPTQKSHNSICIPLHRCNLLVRNARRPRTALVRLSTPAAERLHGAFPRSALRGRGRGRV
ncbi:hypothetical protein EVAR_33053_1 [Eumeta japonica]|uniref:Uncharacterized protein n=1 Tax=Eumeta variegata TaxID=151549 RepID=A0A4C1WWZ1_EUMVA|nr:hypothetical protein EVAR_33053_1 [Eumeta japonica]